MTDRVDIRLERAQAYPGGDIAAAATDPLLDVFDAATPECRAELLREILERSEGKGEAVTLPGGVARPLNLRGAPLGKIRLGGACLSAADLRDANLEEAFLADADLADCLLAKARLAKADLVGASLARADLSEADLSSGLLEDANLEGATMRFARLEAAALDGANLSHADAWGANFDRADLRGADLAGARLGDTNLRGANLSGANLRGAILTKSDLSEARLEQADLRDAVLGYARLGGAVLTGAKLQGQDLGTCTLEHVHLSKAHCNKTQMSREQLGGGLGEELNGDFQAAANGYLVLERNFSDLGQADAAAWAYGRRRRMQKRLALHQARSALAAGDFQTAAGRSTAYAGDQLTEWVCDYGESVFRVLASVFAVFVIFSLIYGLTGSVMRVSDGVRQVTRRPIDLVIFSLLAMTTSGSPAVDIVPRNEYVHLLTGVQAAIGIFLTGLLGFVAGHRIRR